MEWHRDGKGGYYGQASYADADATITRAQSEGGWVVKTRVYGQVVDIARFRLIADAKWHAQEVASVKVL